MWQHYCRAYRYREITCASMIFNLVSVVSLLAVAAVWCVTELSPASIEPRTLVLALTPLSIVLLLVGLACRKRAPAAGKCLGIAAALSCAEAARLGWLREPIASPYILWGAAFSMALVVGLVFRKIPEPLPLVTASDDTPEPGTEPERMNWLAWLVFLAVAALSGFIFLYRLTDVPAELYAYGTQSLSAAARLLRGEVSLKDMILFHEMTQEECGHSLPYVLWHALFQLACGGMSVFAGRLACATAAWLSVLMMFRVGRKIGGVPLGLAAMASFGLMPLTMFDARAELILSFSSLLILLFIDSMLGYMRRPTLPRALWMGFAFLLTFYGVANIKLLVVGSCVTFLFAWIRSKLLRQKSWHLVLSALMVGLLALPQILEWPKVSHQMRGRGEHIFGGVLPHLTLEDPRKPTKLQKALWILEENGQVLVETTFGPYRQLPSSLPATLYVPLIVALGLALGNIFRTDRLLITLLLAGSYFGPAISIPLGWIRLLMLNSAQAIMIGSLWSDLYKLFRAMRLRGWAAVFAILIAASALVSVKEPIQSYLGQNIGLALSRSYALKEPPGTLIFFTDHFETSGNVMRWNPPKLGRDSLAERPVIVIREESIPAIKGIVEQLNVPAIIMSNEAPPAEFASAPGWTSEQEPGQMWVMRHAASGDGRTAFVQALDTRTLDSSSPVFMERVYYQTYRLVLTPLQPEQPLQIQFTLPQKLDRVFIIARGRDSFTSPVDVSLDGGALALTGRSTEANGKKTSWYEAASMPQGTHTLTLKLQPGTAEPVRYVDDVVIIGVP